MEASNVSVRASAVERLTYVRFGSSRHLQCKKACRNQILRGGEITRWAITELMQRSKKRLFNQLVGTHLKLMRNCEAEGLRSLKVDHQLVLGGRLHRQVARFFSLWDAIDICRSFPMRFDGVETSPDAVAMSAFGQTGSPRRL